MKVEAECAPCLLARAMAEACEATTNPALRFRAMSEIIKLLNREFRPTSVPADLGTKRDRLIKRLTSNSDPYKRNKKMSNERALRMLPKARKFVEEGYTQQDRFKRACLCAMVGNIMEFDIPGHKFTLSALAKSFREAAKDLVVDDIDKAYELAKKASSILYLADNAGEIVFDTLLVEQLKNMGLKVTYVVKGGPIINDATLEDVALSGMDKLADEIVTTGADAVGLLLKEVSPEFLKIYNEAELVFAKGMGYAETLTEYKLTKPHFLLFRTKCNPVANYFCAPRHKNIAKLMP
ncbi:MAG: ARMT1-like domain-containing protein [Candidatus Bathyarchaeota archaeon]|nr:ARMT1-like domain-containing protein [Candidatus Bathyarchaeota archaeon]